MMIDEKKYHIILIEDDEEDAFLLEEFLSEKIDFIYQLDKYDRLNNFLDNEHNGADIVLSDMNLPDSSGLDTVKSVLQKIADTPLIVLTGNNDEEIANQSINIGSQDYLVKGKFGSQQLIKAIKFAISRKAVKDELRHNKNLLQNVFNGSPINQILMDNEMKITDINNSALSLLHQTRDFVMGQSLPELFRSYIPDYNEDVSKLLGFLKEGIKSNKVYSKIQLQLPVSKSKEYKNGIFLVTAKHIPDPYYHRVLIGLNEITDLEHAKIKAEQANEYKNNFIANMSHEIRTPMNGVIGFSELLKENHISNEKKDKFLDIIIKNGHQLLHLIDDIIDIAKIESNDLLIKNNAFCLSDLMTELYTMFDAMKVNRNKAHLELQLCIPPEFERLKIITDRNRLTQVMDNLIGNSLKFTSEGYIKYGFKLVGDFIEFFVEDSGRGIPKDQMNEIFDRFKQVRYEDSVQLGGTGLGLAIAKGIIQLMGGDMNVTSKVGSGTRFLFTIPFVPEKPVIVHKAHMKNDINMVLKDKNILIADDEEFIQYYFKEVFRNMECHIDFVDNGLEAVKAYRNKRYDLVLMDLRMPEMNGFKAIEKILDFDPKASIIAQTAYAMPDEREKCFYLGCKDYITKPIIKKALFEAVRKTLN